MKRSGVRNGEEKFFTVTVQHTAIGKGVAIFVHPKSILELTIKDSVAFVDDRIVKIECSVENNNFVILSIYEPRKDDTHKQILFLRKREKLTESLCDKQLILAGDFNFYLDPNLDKKGGVKDKLSCYGKQMHIFMENFSLVDI